VDEEFNNFIHQNVLAFWTSKVLSKYLIQLVLQLSGDLPQPEMKKSDLDAK
jgi:hypothetical protein